MGAPGGVKPGKSGSPYRVMVCDDSAVIRGLLNRALESEQDISVIASVGDGKMAVSSIQRNDVEIVILDIEMPVMDGLTALPLLLQARPGVQVIVASTLTRRNAEISLKAMSLGATDYVAKPTASELTSAADFKRDLVLKVRELASSRRRAEKIPLPLPVSASAAASLAPTSSPSTQEIKRSTPPAPRLAASSMAAAGAGPRTPSIRPLSGEGFDILAIGSSTGGPQALFKVLTDIRGSVRQPIVITQHMPATFTTILAEHITRISGWPAAEGVDGETLEPGRVYVAPGDFHMLIEGGSAGRRIKLDKSPPENFCRPSVDPMLRSVVRSYGRRVLCVILTGMGQDGLVGGKAVVEAGGSLVAQDEASSVVWGMPGAVAMAGLCGAILPLDQIGQQINKLALRSAA